MCSRFLERVCAAALIGIIGAQASANETGDLRVCADPDNLPFSSATQTGFENAIAKIVADDLHMRLRYDWMPQRRAYVRKTMGEGRCDVFIGVPVDFERVLTTHPYYASGYVFVTRATDRAVTSFGEPRLRILRVGVEIVGDDLAATPPGHALARAGAIDNVIGYSLYGKTPAAARMIEDLVARRLDVALIWGPQAGYFASHASTPLRVTLAHAPEDLSIPFEFAIAMGVKKGNRELQQRLNEALERRRNEIDAVLARFAVPRTDVERSRSVRPEPVEGLLGAKSASTGSARTDEGAR